MTGAATALMVPSDDEGVRTAIAELLEESLVAEERRRIESLAETAANGAEMLAALEAQQPKRTLADGYYLWASHLMIIERMLGLNMRCGLTADEARGVTLLRDAAVEFARKHPPCPHCGASLADARSTYCRACGKRTDGGS